MQRGFAPILVILIVVLLLGLTGGYFFYQNKNSLPMPGGNKACTLEAKICPDGGSVGRSGPNCEFESCPSFDVTRQWQVFTNEEYSFKYPKTYILGGKNSDKDSIYLQKNAEFTDGGGYGGGDVLKKGTSFSSFFIPKEVDLSIGALKKSYGTEITTKTISLNGYQGVEVIFPQAASLSRVIYINVGKRVLMINLDLGFENSSSDNQIYSNEFDQILSTFKFN